MNGYHVNARVVAVIPHPVRDRLVEIAADRGYTASHYLREIITRELDRLDADKSAAKREAA